MSIKETWEDRFDKEFECLCSRCASCRNECSGFDGTLQSLKDFIRKELASKYVTKKPTVSKEQLREILFMTPIEHGAVSEYYYRVEKEIMELLNGK